MLLRGKKPRAGADRRRMGLTPSGMPAHTPGCVGAAGLSPLGPPGSSPSYLTLMPTASAFTSCSQDKPKTILDLYWLNRHPPWKAPGTQNQPLVQSLAHLLQMCTCRPSVSLAIISP